MKFFQGKKICNVCGQLAYCNSEGKCGSCLLIPSVTVRNDNGDQCDKVTLFRRNSKSKQGMIVV